MIDDVHTRVSTGVRHNRSPYWVHSNPEPASERVDAKTRRLQDLETSRTLIGVALNDLEQILPWVRYVGDAQPRLGFGFLTPAGKRIQDQLVIKERGARRWNELNTGVEPSGDIRAPGNINVYALQADVTMTLTRFVRHTEKALKAAGVCAVPRIPDCRQLDDLIDVTRRLVGLTANTKVLRDLAGRLQRHVESATKTVDGPSKCQHPDPCPHCGRMTLVVYHRDGIIRCEEDPHTGRYETCVCDDSFCECKIRHHRHEWDRKKKTQRWGWLGLADRIKQDQQHKQLKEPTMQSPENTSREPDLATTMGLLSGDLAGSIEAQERRGQDQLLRSQVLPADTGGSDADFEALGFKFGATVDGDDLFREATLPAGWAREGSDHAMGSYLVDGRGVRRVSVFYKAAFYDRRADMHLVNVGYEIATGFVYGDAPEPVLHPDLTDDERADALASVDSYIARAEENYDIYGDRLPRAWALRHALIATGWATT